MQRELKQMAGSLRDQLVQAGLATSTQAKKAQKQAEAEQRARRQDHSAGSKEGGRKAKKNAGTGTADTPSAQAKARKRAQELNAEKLKRDRELARSRNDKAAQRALRAEIRQIITQNDQRASATADDDVPYNFVHGKKIKRIYIPAAQRDQLSRGALVIVNNDGRYHLVSSAVAAQLRERNPKCIIAAHDDKAPEPGSDDEYYAKFKVPDDMDW